MDVQAWGRRVILCHLVSFQRHPVSGHGHRASRQVWNPDDRLRLGRLLTMENRITPLDESRLRTRDRLAAIETHSNCLRRSANENRHVEKR
jgi:hypothetical protein